MSLHGPIAFAFATAERDQLHDASTQDSLLPGRVALD
jgi:hypothetical protein